MRRVVDLGVYVHFPWCRARCPYCDFSIAVARRGAIPHARYADAILAELHARAPRFAGRTLASIYFGGGTPSLWDPDQIARVIGAVRAGWDGDDVEVTVEANPDDCSPETLRRLRHAGANRLSIGAQSFTDADLVALGRVHDAQRARDAVAAACAAGFDDVSLDLIYALPGRGPGDWERTLETAVA